VGSEPSPFSPLSIPAEEEISNAINISNFSDIMKAAHRIKGSASYLCCEPLREASLKLQEAGHSGTVECSNPDKLLDEIKTLFEQFQKILVVLRTEISSKH